MKRKVYLGGRWRSRFALRRIRDRIEALGDFEICSSWIDRDVESTRPEAEAHRDVGDCLSADLCIFDATSRSRRGGAHVEFGIALAYGIPLIVVGPQPRNIYEAMPAVKRYPSWAQALQALRLR